jgi:hypothetical protein
MAKLFFSYSHRDADLRDELETHLAPLKREGVLETWHDRRIGAGKEFANEISRHLEEAISFSCWSARILSLPIIVTTSR